MTPSLHTITEKIGKAFEEKFRGQNELSQAILSALEYRGFYDAGKYLDDDISKRIAPILKSFIVASMAEAWTEAVEEYKRSQEHSAQILGSLKVKESSLIPEGEVWITKGAISKLQ